MAEFIDQLNQQLQVIGQKFSDFFNFIGGKLQNFPNLSIGEQISYPAIGLGLILIIVSIVLFVI